MKKGLPQSLEAAVFRNRRFTGSKNQESHNSSKTEVAHPYSLSQPASRRRLIARFAINCNPNITNDSKTTIDKPRRIPKDSENLPVIHCSVMPPLNATPIRMPKTVPEWLA